MFEFCCCLLEILLLSAFRSRRSLIVIILTLKKENEILKRHLNHSGKNVQTNQSERFIISILSTLSDLVGRYICFAKPETVLKWQRYFIRKHWTYKNPKTGRPAITIKIKQMILKMKNENILWGSRRISGELKKLGIDIHHTTVHRIIQTFRKNGHIKSTGSWNKFLKAHWNSLFATDFFTVDPLFGKRMYVLFIIQLKSRRLVQWRMTEHPTREFVRQQIIDFEDSLDNEHAYLIHDNGSQYITIDYSDYGITGIRTGIRAPNMNAFAERFVRSFREEALDHFILFSKKQIKKIVDEYVNYYNKYRHHQGIDDIPEKSLNRGTGKVMCDDVLFGLHHNYYRSSA